MWSWIFNSNYGLLNYFLSLFGIDAIPWLNDPQYALAALIIFSIWKSLAFNILIFLSGLSSISQDIYQAARIDSTPQMRVFFKITVPQLRPIIVYAFLMGLINAFKVYNEVFSLFQSKAGPAQQCHYGGLLHLRQILQQRRLRRGFGRRPWCCSSSFWC